MIEFIFTLDYEIYGDGTGQLAGLIYEPAAGLKEIFGRHQQRFVTFVEVAELEAIEAYGTDPAIDLVKRQIRDLHRDDFEIALHLHPQWCNARYDGGKWFLDLSEYNLCKLPKERIAAIVERSLSYMRHAMGDPHFAPISFRAGNWLFQPTQAAAGVIAEQGIRIDSSVFKGGLQHHHGLDYRPALRNGYYWSFGADVNQPDPMGPCIEVPIHADMVPFWKMPTSKRMAFSNRLGISGGDTRNKLSRIRDFARFRYPLKLDFCRMTLDELTSMVERVIDKDRSTPETYKPLVAIGHTKDRPDYGMVDSFLDFLREKQIKIGTFESIYPRLIQAKAHAVALAGLSSRKAH